MPVQGSLLHAQAQATGGTVRAGARPGIRDAAPGWTTVAAFLLPLLAAILADAVANSPTANAPSAFAMFELFALSLATAALLLGMSARRRRPAAGSRNVLLAVAWVMLVAESWGLSNWLLRGLH